MFIKGINNTVVPELKIFNESVAGIDSERAINLANFIYKVVEAAQHAKDASIDSLKTFANGLPAVGENISSYYENIKGVDVLKLIGLNSALKTLDNVSKSVSGEDTKGLKSFLNSFKNLGTESITSFTSSLKNATTKAKNAISTLFSELQSKIEKSKSGLYGKMYTVGSYAVGGFTKGIDKNTFKAEAVAKIMAEKAIKAAKKELDEHSPSKVFEQIGAFTVLGYVNGVDKNRDKAINATSGMCKKIIKMASKEMIAGASVMKTLTNSFFGSYTKKLHAKEIKDLYKTSSQAVSTYAKQLYKESDQYKTDTKAVKQHKKELKKLYNERQKLRDKLAKSTKKNSSSIKKELKSNAKDIKSKKKELFKDQNDVAKHIKSTLNELKTSIADSVKDFTDPFKQSIDTGISLFEKFDKGTSVSTSRILKNMKSQTEGYAKWRDNLAQLKKKGLSDGLIDMLREEGPNSGNIRAFLKMSSGEIKKANSYYAKSQQLAGKTFMDNFNSGMDSAKQWSANIKKLAKKGLSQDAIEAFGALGIEGSQEYINALLTMTPKQITQFNKKYKQYLQLDDSIANQVVASYSYAGSEALKALQKKLSKKNTKAIGKNVCKGLSNGIKENGVIVTDSATKLGTNVVKAFNKTLKIHSPSKVMEESGKYITDGLVDGMNTGSKNVENASTILGDNMIASMWSALQQVIELANSSLDAEPTIKPVLDLSDVISGSSKLDTLLSSNYVQGIRTDLADGSVNGAVGKAGTNYSYTQIINSPQPVSRIDIYRDTNQLLRRKATV